MKNISHIQLRINLRFFLCITYNSSLFLRAKNPFSTKTTRKLKNTFQSFIYHHQLYVYKVLIYLQKKKKNNMVNTKNKIVGLNPSQTNA